MAYYDEQLQDLQQQTAKKAHIEKKLADLKQQRTNLDAKVSELNNIMQKEQADVDRLESRSLSSIFYGMLGKKEERLTKEREEAYAAVLKYETASQELTAVKRDIRSYTNELQPLLGCEERYAKLLDEKSAAIKSSGIPAAAEILKLEEHIAYLESQKREVREAIYAGNRARDLADEVLDQLRSAEGWGTWDLMGGGLISDIAKHDALDTAQSLVNDLQVQLRSFKTELADVTIDTDMQVNIDGFLRFADFFFDGIFADWTVLDKIHNSMDQVQTTKDQIDELLSKLHYMLSAAEGEQEKAGTKLDTLIRETTL